MVDNARRIKDPVEEEAGWLVDEDGGQYVTLDFEKYERYARVRGSLLDVLVLGEEYVRLGDLLVLEEDA